MYHNLRYPPTGSYPLPEKNVLVLSCIDLRLTDNLLHFLHFDNLTNRYDHFALAGTSLMTQCDNHDLLPYFRKTDEGAGTPIVFPHWKATWKDHLAVAKKLHKIEDVYIVEHQSCGAYKEFLDEKKIVELGDETKCHAAFAHALAGDIKVLYPDLKVHCFYIDLRGNVDYLPPIPKVDV